MSHCPNVKEFFLHTSNILRWNNVHLITNPLEEVETCVKTVMHCWHESHRQCDQDVLCIACDKHRDKVPDTERSNITVTAKLFLFTSDHDSIRQAINKTLDRLGLQDIETLLISLSPELSRGALVDHPPCMGLPWVKVPQGTAYSLLGIWPVLEEFVEANKVFRLGVCDMSAEQMEILCAAVKTPPKVNQVFLGSTCLLGEDLENFAKLHDIQLLTHQDSADMLPVEKLQGIISSEISPEDAVGWRPSWLVRYSEYYKNRGVVRSKGYTLFAERDHLPSPTDPAPPTSAFVDSSSSSCCSTNNNLNGNANASG